MENDIHVCIFISSIGFHRKGRSQIEICFIFSPTSEINAILGKFWMKMFVFWDYIVSSFCTNLHIPIPVFDFLHVHNSSSFQFKRIVLR